MVKACERIRRISTLAFWTRSAVRCWRWNPMLFGDTALAVDPVRMAEALASTRTTGSSGCSGAGHRACLSTQPARSGKSTNVALLVPHGAVRVRRAVPAPEPVSAPVWRAHPMPRGERADTELGRDLLDRQPTLNR
jgi:hypothetical protein